MYQASFDPSTMTDVDGDYVVFDGSDFSDDLNLVEFSEWISLSNWHSVALKEAIERTRTIWSQIAFLNRQLEYMSKMPSDRHLNKLINKTHEEKSRLMDEWRSTRQTVQDMKSGTVAKTSF